MKLPKELYEINKVFQVNDYQLFLVGGAIRNLLLGRNPGDFDLASDATPQAIQALFKRVIPTGIEYGTVTVLWKNFKAEITTFRKDGLYRNKRSPESIQFSNNIESDLERRDFTINSIAYNIRTEHVLDLFSGQQDLQAGIIRTIGDADTRFNEDALRMLRGIRFAATLNFTIEEHTLKSICKNRMHMSHIAKERIQNELIKILTSEHCNVGLALLRETKLLEQFFPSPAHDCPAIDYIPAQFPESRLALYYYSCGLNRQEMYTSLTNLLFPKRIITRATHLLAHLNPEIFLLRKGPLRHFLSSLGRDYIDAFMPLSKALATACGNNGEALLHAVEKEKASPLQLNELVVDGTTLIQKLGIKPGEMLGTLLKYALERVLDEPSQNKEDILLKLIQQHSKNNY